MVEVEKENTNSNIYDYYSIDTQDGKREGKDTKKTTTVYPYGRTKEEHQIIVRHEKKKNGLKRHFKKCIGIARPEIICKDCDKGYPYYDCQHRDDDSDGNGYFKCKVECSSSKKLKPTVRKIKCRDSGWKKEYPKPIQCLPNQEVAKDENIKIVRKM